MGSSSDSEESVSSASSNASLSVSRKKATLKDFEDSNKRGKEDKQESVVEEEEPDEIRIDADFPPIRADLGR